MRFSQNTIFNQCDGFLINNKLNNFSFFLNKSEHFFKNTKFSSNKKLIFNIFLKSKNKNILAKLKYLI